MSSDEKKSTNGDQAGTVKDGIAPLSKIFERLRPRNTKNAAIRRELGSPSGVKDSARGREAKKERWLRVYRQTGQKPAAHRAVGCTAATFYDWLRDDPEFKAALFAADEAIADALEAEAIRRAHAGSDFLLTVLLNANRPGKFRYSKDGVGGNVDPESVAIAMARHQADIEASFGEEPKKPTNGSGQQTH